jgi:peptidyl-prolyl cis-trans isomerase SurA
MPRFGRDDAGHITAFTGGMTMLGRFARAAIVLAVSVASAMAAAQGGDPLAGGGTGLDIPGDLELLGEWGPETAMEDVTVNGEAISQRDVDARLAFAAASGGAALVPGDVAWARPQMLRNLIDETLQLQEAAAQDILVNRPAIESAYQRLARNSGRTPEQLTTWLRSIGSSELVLHRQIQAALAWQMLMRRQAGMAVGVDDEVGAAISGVAEMRPVMPRDPGDTVMSLAQMSLAMPGSTIQARQYAGARLANSARGCGHAAEAARDQGAEITFGDTVRVGDLPEVLQQPMLDLEIGKAAPSFTSHERVSVLILCGRDDPVAAGAPDADQDFPSLAAERMNRRAQRHLRDLRRDAMIEYHYPDAWH